MATHGQVSQPLGLRSNHKKTNVTNNKHRLITFTFPTKEKKHLMKMKSSRPNNAVHENQSNKMACTTSEWQNASLLKDKLHMGSGNN